MEPEFKNIDELKNRLMPALEIRVKELRKEKRYITVDELWEYFIYSWRYCRELTLSDVVDDILNKEITL